MSVCLGDKRTGAAGGRHLERPQSAQDGLRRPERRAQQYSAGHSANDQQSEPYQDRIILGHSDTAGPAAQNVSHQTRCATIARRVCAQNGQASQQSNRSTQTLTRRAVPASVCSDTEQYLLSTAGHSASFSEARQSGRFPFGPDTSRAMMTPRHTKRPEYLTGRSAATTASRLTHRARIPLV